MNSRRWKFFLSDLQVAGAREETRVLRLWNSSVEGANILFRESAGTVGRELLGAISDFSSVLDLIKIARLGVSPRLLILEIPEMHESFESILI